MTTRLERLNRSIKSPRPLGTAIGAEPAVELRQLLMRQRQCLTRTWEVAYTRQKFCWSYNYRHGGTGWQDKNGVWICAQDARGKPIYNYSPKSFAVLIQPSVPLTKGPNGR